MARVIGLTGGIAMGKSTISDFLQQRGIPIVDADKIAHQVLRKAAVKQQLIQIFSTDILDEHNQINRAELGQLVFNDSQLLDKLDAIVHPVIRQDIVEQLHQYQDAPLVILDAPVLFEQQYTDLVDQIMVVKTTPDIQLKRLVERDKLLIKDARNRIKSQMSIDEKIKKADVIIDTSGTIEETRLQVVKWLDDNNF